jgi:hypothetical protein
MMMSLGAGVARADHTQRLGQVSICYEPIFGAGFDRHLRPVPVLQLFGDLQTGDVLGARLDLKGTPPRAYTAHGRVTQALDRSSHAAGVDPTSHVESAFALTYVSSASWVSFYGDLVLSAHGADSPPIRVECYDRHVDPDVEPSSARYYVVGVASTVVSPWGATPDIPEGLKPAADRNAARQCAGATREGEYLVTYEPASGNRPLFVVLVSAHYRCPEPG